MRKTTTKLLEHTEPQLEVLLYLSFSIVYLKKKQKQKTTRTNAFWIAELLYSEKLANVIFQEMYMYVC